MSLRDFVNVNNNGFKFQNVESENLTAELITAESLNVSDIDATNIEATKVDAGSVQVNALSSVLSGNGVPDAGLGANGDLYLRKDPADANTVLYVKVAGAWTAISAA